MSRFSSPSQTAPKQSRKKHLGAAPSSAGELVNQFGHFEDFLAPDFRFS